MYDHDCSNGFFQLYRLRRCHYLKLDSCKQYFISILSFSFIIKLRVHQRLLCRQRLELGGQVTDDLLLFVRQI